ncbi:response regulator transcription factor [bacterium]|nr:response regulator transcription factor [bacterium]
MPHLLIIEDDPKLGPMLKSSLEYAGYRVSLASDGRAGLAAARFGDAQLIILDLMLPGLDGFTILKNLRRELYNMPIILLTARGMESDRIEGFRLGCDDYVTKPFSLNELIARVRAVLRRSGYKVKPAAVHSGGLIIDPETRQAQYEDRPLTISGLEFDLLYTLASHPGQALSRNFLLDEVWGEETDVTNRVVDARVLALRRKIEENPDEPKRIVTVYKVGYRWQVDMVD